MLGHVAGMFAGKTILGGLLAICLGATAMADPQVRPFSRDDAIAVKQDASLLRLAGFRANPRPDHMIRYPVQIETSAPSVRPQARQAFLPKTRWDFKDGSDLWTRAAMVAVGEHGEGLDSVVPRDIAAWCPAYAANSPVKRRAFWVGMMSALAKHESTYNPRAVGGGDLWYGLLQIYPDTAQRYGCRATTGEALKDPEDNLSCAARIMNVTVTRDNAVAVHDGRWRGVAADWGPMSNRGKIAEMAAWTSSQSYCQPETQVRPVSRPAVRTVADLTRFDQAKALIEN